MQMTLHLLGKKKLNRNKKTVYRNGKQCQKDKPRNDEMYDSGKEKQFKAK